MAVPPKSRLGRGFSALMGGSEPASDAADTPVPAGSVAPIQTLPLTAIDVNPRQPRRTFDSASLDELAASIKVNGIIQPIVVRPAGDRYELIAGERRFRAAGLAGLAEVPVVVRPVDDYTQAQWALVENIHREDLNVVERAEAYATLLRDLHLTQAELAGRLGEQRSSVANYLRLLDLQPAVRELLRSGRLTLGHAKVLAGMTDAADQIRLAEQCTDDRWSVRELERFAELASTAEADAQPAAAPVAASKATQAHFAELEQQLVQALGVRVNLRRGRKTGTGQIVLHYASLDQFDELVKRWGISLSDH